MKDYLMKNWKSTAAMFGFLYVYYDTVKKFPMPTQMFPNPDVSIIIYTGGFAALLVILKMFSSESMAKIADGMAELLKNWKKKDV